MMRMKGVLTAAALLAGTMSLPAAPASARDDGLTAEFGACMDASGGVTFDMIDCMSAEHERQDARLNQAYKAVMAGLGDDRKDALRAAQRAWIQFRDANCDFHYDPQGGTLARVEANSCMMSETAERAGELERIAEVY